MEASDATKSALFSLKKTKEHKITRFYLINFLNNILKIFLQIAYCSFIGRKVKTGISVHKKKIGDFLF